MINLTPAQIRALTGISPDVLRDWRRRRLIEGFGSLVSPLSKGRSPRKRRTQDRPNWGYSLGDAIAFAVARNLTGLGLDLKDALALAQIINPKVAAWLVPTSDRPGRAELETPFLVAWPSGEGDDAGLSGVESGQLHVVALSDLSRAPVYIGPKAILIDCAKLAKSLPDGLRQQMLTVLP